MADKKVEVAFKGLCAFVRNNGNLAKVTMTTVLMVTDPTMKHVPILAIQTADLAPGVTADAILETTNKNGWGDYKARKPDSWSLWYLAGHQVTLKAKEQPDKVTFETKSNDFDNWSRVANLGTVSKPECNQVNPAYLSTNSLPNNATARVVIRNGHLQAGPSDNRRYKFDKDSVKHTQSLADFALLTITAPKDVEITISDPDGGNGKLIGTGAAPRLFFSNLPTHVMADQPSPKKIEHFKLYWGLTLTQTCQDWGDVPVEDLGGLRLTAMVPVACPPVDLCAGGGC